MIPKGWKTYNLSDLINLIGGGTPKTDVTDYWDGDIPWLSVVDFNSGSKHVYSTEKSITEKGLEESSTKILKKGQLIVSARGTVGEMAMLGKDMAFNQSCYGIDANNKTNNDFLYYLLKSSIQRIKKKTHGAVFDTITKQTFENISVTIPTDLSEQSRIASILSSLDDKIELNLQMNKTLESIAQAIFKEWFVDFKFPGFDGEMVDGLPKGWRKGQIGDIADVIDCLHSKKPERVQTNTGCILLQLNNILDNGLLDPTDKFYISEQDYSNWISRIEITEGDCVITNVGRVGSVARIPKGIKAALGRNMTGIRLNKNYPFPTFLIQLLVSDYMKIEIEKKKDFGTILDALNVKNIPKLSFALPKTELISHFERIVSPMRSKMENSIKENLTLSSIRDTLLPKLMTGKIRVA